MRFIIILLSICLMMATITGCHEYTQREPSNLDGAIKLFESLRTVNTASTPLNPYALPIGAGLTGVIAMLEALRRVEQSKRKYAEHELNNNNKNHT